MEKFVINGGRPLVGEIEVRGAKNAAAPILAACLLTKKPCVIDNLPLIEDIFRLVEILESMGVKINWLDKRKIRIEAADLDLKNLKLNLISRLRASILLLGPLLTRFKYLRFIQPGGCAIGARPLDAHIDAFREMGIQAWRQGKFLDLENKKLKSTEVILGEFSVTATENLLMLASSLPAKTIIKTAATEPHVQDLCFFLKKMGVKIRGVGTHTLEVYGSKNLQGAEHVLIPDANEAGTFLSLAAVNRGRVLIKKIDISHLDLFLHKLKQMRVDFSIKGSDKIFVKSRGPRSQYHPIKIQAMPYPGIPTDLQSSLAVLCTQARGVSLIHDPLFEDRLRYLEQLNRMGAKTIICDPHRAVIIGPTPLYGAKINSYDLRAGASLIIAALAAKGESVIADAYQVDRGYEKIETRLQKLGVDIKRIKE